MSKKNKIVVEDEILPAEPAETEQQEPALEPLKRFGVFDAAGHPRGFYATDVPGSIPLEAVEITDEQWLELIQNPGQRVYIDGKVSEFESDAADDVARYNISMKRKRLYCYQTEADPLFFKAQRNEATMEEWLAKVAEIKQRFPLKD